MSTEQEIKWLHSNGWDNKDPLYDLGGSPSRFEIATQPMNNLFDDITPEEAQQGREDYRCIYVINKTLETVYKNVQVSLDSNDLCASIIIGSKLLNDEQIICLDGTPQISGYVILETEFGPPFTCYWTGDFASFADEIQTKIRLTPYCADVTVVQQPIGDLQGCYLVTFQGDLQNRKVDLIRVIRNRLVFQQGDEFRVSTAVSTDPFNHQGDTEIKVTQIISGIPSAGTINIFDRTKGIYSQVSYSDFSEDIFDLTTALPFDLIFGPSNTPNISYIPYGYDAIWVDLPDIAVCPVVIRKQQDGWPIRQFANLIDNETIQPDWTPVAGTLDMGMLQPLDGFFMWIKRDTVAGTPGCTGSFGLMLTGNQVD